MLTDPHLFFAEVSLDLSGGEFHSALEKIELHARALEGTYTFHLLYARALKGVLRHTESFEQLNLCCRIAPHNEVAWKELLDLHFLRIHAPSDPFISELEQLSLALAEFEAPRESENGEPTTISEQKQPFPDEESIPVPTESLAAVFKAQGAYKKAVRVYTDLIQLNPSKAEDYKQNISTLLEKL
ncbi:MAG: hypothetical protein C1942_03875 [Prosthecochloris sp.]|uniref:hypothetical protein n=1 Tax=Prosthecochloris sp. TaxID=290513 RepID=UPI0013C55B4A|nr:hypothetical protein [Prosthecochloris sp.]NEX11825.1 hypothetical protein [Prosthecochloris sp.]